MEKEKVTELNDNELENVVGGYYPADKFFEVIGVSDIIKFKINSGDDCYYGTKRNDETWKNVGTEHMLFYVGGIKGFDSDEYKALCDFCRNGECTYKGKKYTLSIEFRPAPGRW